MTKNVEFQFDNEDEVKIKLNGLFGTVVGNHIDRDNIKFVSVQYATEGGEVKLQWFRETEVEAKN